MYYYLVWILCDKHTPRLEVTIIVMIQQWYCLNAVSSVEVFFSGGRWEKISWSQRRRWWWHERGRRRLPAPRWGQDRSSEFHEELFQTLLFYHHFHFLDRSSEFQIELFQIPWFYHHFHFLVISSEFHNEFFFSDIFALPSLSLSRYIIRVSQSCFRHLCFTITFIFYFHFLDWTQVSQKELI